MKLTKSILFFLGITLCLNAFGKDSTEKRLSLHPLPSIFHTPETSWGGGITLIGYFKPKDTLTRKSNAQFFLDATLRKQIQFQGDYNIFTRKNSFYIRGTHDLSKFPELFYGFGNDTKPEDECQISFNYFNIAVTGFKRLKDNVYIGHNIHHQSIMGLSKPIFQSINKTYDEYSFTGFGLSFLKDERDYLLNPQQGHYIELKTNRYVNHTQGESGFWNLSADLRKYHTFAHNIVLNTNLYAVQNQGVVPFRLMPYIGGPHFMRGYYAGRFRDNNLMMLRNEVRKHLFWRIGIAGFAGVGQVYSNVREFEVNRFHYNYGGGLRFQLHKNSPANIRFDYGRTADSHGFYVVFGESF